MAKKKNKRNSPSSKTVIVDVSNSNETFGSDLFGKVQEISTSKEEDLKREKAIKKYLPIIERQNLISNAPQRVKDLFLDSVTLPSAHMKKFTSDDANIFIAAQAIWLLDHFIDSPSESEFLQLLPLTTPDFDDVYPFHMRDTVHSCQFIWSVAHVLMERDDKEKETFQAIISLIDQETADQLIKLFEEHILDFFKRALQLANQNTDIPFLSDSPNPADGFYISMGHWNSRVFLVNAPLLLNSTRGTLNIELEDPQAVELLMNYGTGDPYDLCAAFMLLSYQEHELVHLNTLTAAVLAYAKSRLPWGPDDMFIKSTFIDRGSSIDRSMMNIKNIHREPADHKPMRSLRTYEQILFHCSQMILPRRSYISSELMEELKSMDLSETMAHEIAMITYMYFYSSNHDIPYQERLVFVPPVSEPIPKIHTGCNAEGMPEPALNNDAANQQSELLEQNKKAFLHIETLERKLNQLQKNINEAEREKNKLREQIKSSEESTQSEHDELIALREAIFKLSQTSEDSEPDEAIVLPCKTSRRILVYGGHDSWRKQIQEFLPDVTFFDKDMLPRPEVIKNADIVWIQPNALGHKYYYLIINTIRSNHIPLRYFGYASARKCAEELVINEINT